MQGGIIGSNPVIPSVISVNDNVAMQYDYRSVYASLLQDWLCVPPADLNSILLNNYQVLPIVQQSACSGIGVHELNQSAGENLISNYPNPFTDSTYISFKTGGGHTLIQIFDGEGHLINTPVDSEYAAGEYKIWFENENFAPGIYYARLQNGSVQQVRNMLIAQ